MKRRATAATRSPEVPAILLVVAVLGSSCAGDAKKLEESREQLASWAATASVVSRDWGAGVAPTRFAKSALDKARDGLDKESRTLARLANRSTEAAALEHFAAGLRAQIESTAAAVSRGDREAARVRAPALARVGEAVRPKRP